MMVSERDFEPEQAFLVLVEKMYKTYSTGSTEPWLLSDLQKFLDQFQEFTIWSPELEQPRNTALWENLKQALWNLHCDINGRGGRLYYFLKQHAYSDVWDPLYRAIHVKEENKATTTNPYMSPIRGHSR